MKSVLGIVLLAALATAAAAYFLYRDEVTDASAETMEAILVPEEEQQAEREPGLAAESETETPADPTSSTAEQFTRSEEEEGTLAGKALSSLGRLFGSNKPAYGSRSSARERKARLQEQNSRSASRPPLRFPSTLGDVRFGMAPAAVDQRYPAHRRNIKDGVLTLVHYSNRRRTAVGRFAFERGMGLSRVEIRLRPGRRGSTGWLHQKVKGDYAAQYGPPEDGKWSDGRMTIRIKQHREEYVAIIFTAAK